jgi:hypothetical protein
MSAPPTVNSAPAATPPLAYRLVFAPGAIARRLWIALGALTLLYLGFQAWARLRPPVPLDTHLLFDVDSETSVPNWFVVAIFWAAAALMAALAARARRQAAPHGWRWLALGALSAWVSLDQLTDMRHVLELPEWLTGPIALVVLGVVILAVFGRFVLELPARARVTLIAALACWGLGMVAFPAWSGVTDPASRSLFEVMMVALGRACVMASGVLLLQALFAIMQALEPGDPTLECTVPRARSR